MEDILLSANAGQMIGAILRPGNIYGREYLEPTAPGVVGAFVRHLVQGTPVVVRDGGRAARDFVHVDDVVEAILLGLGWSRGLAVWNVGSGIATRVNDVLRSLCRVFGRNPVATLATPRNPTDVNAIALDWSRVHADSGWKPRISLSRGLRDLAGFDSVPLPVRTENPDPRLQFIPSF
jgi:nucleoside-diphosphate-sugar epimerase